MSEDKTLLRYSDLSSFRGEIMGIGAIEVILLHFFMYYKHNDNPLGFIGKLYEIVFSSIGVEMFLLVSGIGLFFSLKSNWNLPDFFKKRFTRVLLPYLIWGSLVYIIDDIIFDGGKVLKAILDFTFVTFFTNGDCLFWYILMACVTYLLAPLVFRGISGKRPLLCIVLWIAGAVIFAEIVKYLCPEMFGNISKAVRRFPTFFIGMYFGRLTYEDKPVKAGLYIMAAAGLVLKAMRSIERTKAVISAVPMYYVHCLYSLFFIVAIVLFFKYIKAKPVSIALKWAGKHSLELYITHIGTIRLFSCFGINFRSIPGYIAVVAVAIAASIVLRFAVDKICSVRKPERG